nr:hypothetical protein [Candidatus Omnitrophota bacterium]
MIKKNKKTAVSILVLFNFTCPSLQNLATHNINTNNTAIYIGAKAQTLTDPLNIGANIRIRLIKIVII